MCARQLYRCDAIVLDRTKLGERDIIVTLLARDGSQKRVVAKGARRPGGKFAARVEQFCEVDCLVAEGKKLDIMSEAELIDAHARLRGDVEKTFAASVLLECARYCCYEDAKDSYLYPLLSRALSACEEAGSRAQLDLVVAAYVMKLLAHSGWFPELRFCATCGDADAHFFSAASGGLLCKNCSQGVEDLHRLSPSELEWLRALISQTFDELLTRSINQDDALSLLGIAHIWACMHLDARLRAFDFYYSL